MSEPNLSAAERLPRYRAAHPRTKRQRPAPMRALTTEEAATLAAMPPIERLAAAHTMQRNPAPVPEGDASRARDAV